MKIQNIKIGTRLILGNSIILFFIVLLGGMAYLQTNQISQNTEDLYNHPLIVGRAVRDINIGILLINRSLKDIVLHKNLNQDQVQELIHSIDTREAEVYKLFDIVKEEYLGGRIQIDSVYKRINAWKALRDKVIFLRQSGKIKEAVQRYENVYTPLDKEILRHMQEMINFSTLKGNEFHISAQNEKDTLNQRIIIVICSIFLLSFIISYFLIKGIKNPLEKLAIVADEYQKGNFRARSDYNSSNVIGLLASTFNNMAESVETELMVNDTVASTSQLMSKENNLKSFCKVMLNAMLKNTKSQVAAIYFLNEEKSHFEHYESIGLSAKNIKSFSAQSNEGEFGALLSDKEITRITEIPDDTVFNFPAVTGSFKPKEIISIPILEFDEVVAVISLASLQNYAPSSIQIVNDLLPALTARISSVLIFQKVSDYAAALNKQNKELALQSDELKEYNIELEIQKKQLDDANQLKSSFLSTMSHELRTPLNSVIALSGVLGRRVKGIIPEDEYNYIGIIERNGKNLLYLINDILDLSRIEAGKEETYFTKFSARDLVESIVNTVEPNAKEKKITLKNNIALDLPVIISDNSKCNHILQNIISNAVKFTEKGSVEIFAEIVDSALHISVKDTGIGIAPEHLPDIFDEFRQADEKSSRRYGGTGLGLAIANKYALLLNGSIEVESVLGVGSTFTVKIPVEPTGMQNVENKLEFIKSNSPSAKNIKLSHNKTHLGKTILIVEDSEPAIIQLSDILTEEGYLTRVARNGKEALDALKISVPDAVILDLMMREIDGFEVLRQIRSMKETQLLPVLILSAKHVTREELNFLKENNIHELLQKGDIKKYDLLAQIKKMVTPLEHHFVKKKDLINSAKKNAPGSKTEEAVILVIEDNPDNLETVKALIGNLYNLITSMDGIEGLEKAKTLKPNLILLDISLPGIDGYKVLDEIRKDVSLKNVPIIALTAKAMKGDREEFLQYGFDGYIAKPIDGDLLEKTILEWLDGK